MTGFEPWIPGDVSDPSNNWVTTTNHEKYSSAESFSDSA